MWRSVAVVASGLVLRRELVAAWHPTVMRVHRGGGLIPRSSVTAQGLTTVRASSPGVLDAGSAEVLVGLRRELSERGLAALVVPSDDPHLSEYVAPCFERRAFVSGFTGSAGMAVVTADRALLWTDSRYWLQAETELSNDWTLMKSGESKVPSVADWLGREVEGVVGVSAAVCSAAFAKELREKLRQVRFLSEELVDIVWGEDRPALPMGQVRVHAMEVAGETVESKLGRVRDALAEKGLPDVQHVIAALDDICWLFNLRGSDIACNPVVLAYALVGLGDEAILFVDERKLDVQARGHLASAKVSVLPYEDAIEYVAKSAESHTIWLDPGRCSEAIALAAPADRRLLESSPVLLMKAVKNQAELDGMRRVHVRDGAAVVKALCELESKVAQGLDLDECDVAETLVRYRSVDPNFLEPSFPTIAGSGPNGAIVHYCASPDSAAAVDATKLLLVDSGGQYLDGTTDATRTVHFGDPTKTERDAFTRVFKGHVALDTAVFPDRVPAFVLDAFARQYLWAVGRDYGHGTGHGVGAALNVHEGPQSISPRFSNMQPLCAGMVVSNEPGYYESGAFGIRIENLLVVEQHDTPGFLRFSKLTMIPIDSRCLDLDLLDDSELRWLNEYHALVLATIAPLLRDDPVTLAWLKGKCAELVREPSGRQLNLPPDSPSTKPLSAAAV